MINGYTYGIFDSGVGGLSVLKKLMPCGGNFVYFADTKNLPYGSKSREQIITYTRSIIEFFISKGIKKVFMACNTSSALAYDTLQKEFENKVKIYPLIQTAAPYIAQMQGKIAVIATKATINSHMYAKEITKNNPKIQVFELACPELVPIVESRLYESPKSIKVIKNYIEPLMDTCCDKIILGCTHYPLLMPILTKFAPKDMFVDPANYMKNLITENVSYSSVEFYVTSNPREFKLSANPFMEIHYPVYSV